jgi:hypothetical protein
MGRKCHVCEAPYLGNKLCESGLQCPRWQNHAGGSRHRARRARQYRQGRTPQHNHLDLRSSLEPQIQLPSGSSATSILSLRPVAEERPWQLAEERPTQRAWSYSTTSTSSGSSASEANTSNQSTSLGSARSLSPSMASSEMSEEWPAGQ